MSDVAVMDHVCSCPNDNPDLQVHDERQGLQHIGVRFWDGGEDGTNAAHAEITVDGILVHGVFEAILGEQGTVWRYRGTPGASRTGRHLCQTCTARARAAGLLSDGATRVYESVEGIIQCVTPEITLCTEKLTGRVELRVKERVV